MQSNKIYFFLYLLSTFKKREKMICQICKREFILSKYRPAQRVCSDPECQHLRQLKNIREWQKRNPSYFKGNPGDILWRQICRQRGILWRQRNGDRLKEYRRNHRESHRLYMREYMRQYRKKKRLALLKDHIRVESNQ